MMMLWLSCLLIGSITCRTLEKAYGSGAPAAAPTVPNRTPHNPGFLWDWGRVGSSSPGSSASQPMPSSSEASQPSALHVPSSAGHGSFRGAHYNPAFSGYEAPYAPSHSSGHGDSGLGGSYGGGYGSAASGYVGASYGYVAPHDESSSSGSAISTGAGTENPEPFFSDLSDLEPVYFYSSRSRYQRGQEAFAQTRYTPGEPIPPFPLSRHSSKATLQPNAPAKAPTKGGF